MELEVEEYAKPERVKLLNEGRPRTGIQSRRDLDPTQFATQLASNLQGLLWVIDVQREDEAVTCAVERFVACGSGGGGSVGV